MQTTFYVLKPSSEPEKATDPDALPAHFDLGCQLAAKLFRDGKRVFMFAESEEHAHMLDEYLWAFDADAFVPHNLAGEGPRNGAPVEISYMPPTNHRQVMINFATLVPGCFNQFNQVIDFVPADTQGKQDARERYKYYRQCGCELTTTES
jgi:DNA polymerase-3 subunit chi